MANIDLLMGGQDTLDLICGGYEDKTNYNYQEKMSKTNMLRYYLSQATGSSICYV